MSSLSDCIFFFYCMYIILTPRTGCTFFSKVLFFYTHYTVSVPPYQPLSTGSGSILKAGPSRASPGISIGRAAVVRVSHALYLELRQCPALPVILRRFRECSQSFGHHTKAQCLSFWTYNLRWVPNHQEPEEKHLEKIHWCWPGFEPEPSD